MTAAKRTEILRAALDAFVRHGFRRVTMGDLAEAAGMSRPALYLVFPNKEAIFRAVVADYVARAAEEARAGLDGRATAADRLRFVLEVWTVRPYELIHEAPHAKELTDSGHAFAGDLVEDAQRTFEALLAGIVSPDADALARRGLGPDDLARTVAVAANGCKDHARDIEELRALVAALVVMVEATLGR